MPVNPDIVSFLFTYKSYVSASTFRDWAKSPACLHPRPEELKALEDHVEYMKDALHAHTAYKQMELTLEKQWWVTFTDYVRTQVLRHSINSHKADVDGLKKIEVLLAYLYANSPCNDKYFMQSFQNYMLNHDTYAPITRQPAP